MKLVIQRVKKAEVKVDEKVVSKITKGFLVLIGIAEKDTKKQADYLAKKLCQMRVFEDEAGKMNLDLKQVGGSLLLVSQFTLYADCTNGNRPSFTKAARPELAEPLYEYFCKQCKEIYQIPIEKGIFGADMKIELINDGPVTIVLEEIDE